MKTWEVIKALTEKPHKKFRSTNEPLVTEIYVNEKGCIEIYSPSLKVGSNNLKLDTDWEEVKEPVSFMEAVKSGKKVKVEHEKIFGELCDLKENYNYLDVVLHRICEYSFSTEVRDVLLNGKWYIE